MGENRKLRVFLCHSSDDKPTVHYVNKLLSSEPWIDSWLDEIKIKPGQDWKFEIEKAIDETDVVIVFLSRNSVSKEGFVQKELKYVLDRFDEKPAGIIYIIPIRIEECEVPKRLAGLQYINISVSNPEWYPPLFESLKLKAKTLGVSFEKDEDRGNQLQSELKKLELESQKLKRAIEIKEIEMKAVLAQAHEVMNTDSLTFLPNRKKIAVDLQEEVARANRYNAALSIIFFDIDRFKNINDTYGHVAGDDVLMQLAFEFRKVVQKPNSIGRYGGEEFLIVLPSCKINSAIELAERLCQLIRSAHINYGEYTFQMAVSAGVVQYKNGKENWEQLLVRADKALYSAKNNGGDQWATPED